MNPINDIHINSAVLIGFYLLVINLVTFLVYGKDKYKARHRKWRTPEATLIILALAGGSIGALLGMLIFHHKTRKARFFLGIPAILILQITFILILFFTSSQIIFL